MKKLAVLSIVILLFASCSNPGSNKDNQSTVNGSEQETTNPSFAAYLALFEKKVPVPDSLAEKFCGRMRYLKPREIWVRDSLVVCWLTEDMDRGDMLYLYTKDGKIIDARENILDATNFRIQNIGDSICVVYNETNGEGEPDSRSTQNLTLAVHALMVSPSGFHYTKKFELKASEFIEAYTEMRKRDNSYKDVFTINSKVRYTNANSSIISFIEILDNNTYEYVLVFNPKEKYTQPLNDQAIYEEIAHSLMYMKTNLFVGHLEQTIDVLNDGSQDYLLSRENSYSTTMNRVSKLLLFDGKSELKTTNVVAKSDFEAGICSFFTGVREELLIDELTRSMTIQRKENISPSGGCDAKELIQLSYDKVWIVDQGNFDSIAKLNTPMLDTLNQFINFPKKFTFIEDRDGKFIIPENLQNGGGSIYELSKYSTSKNTSIYIVKESADNAESYFVAGFKQVDQETAEIYLRPTKSKDHGDDFDAIELNRELKTINIKRDAANTDRYWITSPNEGKPKLATTTAVKYTIVKTK